MIDDSFKSTADQVGEIAKLVQDTQERLDQVARALRTLQERLKHEGSDPRVAGF